MSQSRPLSRTGPQKVYLGFGDDRSIMLVMDNIIPVVRPICFIIIIHKKNTI